VQIDGLEVYLSGRFQCVSVNGFEGSYVQNPCGVPQGSVLGLLCFLLFIEDLSQITLFVNLRLIVIADDTVLLYSERNWDLLEEKVNADLTSVGSWLTRNKLSEIECLVTDPKMCINLAVETDKKAHF
jgi:hypothetical protein